MRRIFLIVMFLATCLVLTGCANIEFSKVGGNLKYDENDIESESNTINSTIEAPTVKKISTESEILKKEEEIGKFSTKIYDKEEDRQNNLSITCSKINGYIVKSHETFSFEDIVGQATPEEGYEKAKIFDNKGNVKEGYGGGKCQVSTTLFNAVRNLDNIEIVERHDHSNKVPYAKTGDDAAVAHGGYDFKFINNNEYDIKILANTDGKNVNVSINKMP